MAQTVVDCWNMAVSAIGNRGAPIKSINDRTNTAEECRRWYPAVRDSVLRAAYWQSVKTTVALERQSSSLPSGSEQRDTAEYPVSRFRRAEPWQPTMPEPPWAFAYAPPDNMLHPRYLRDYKRFSLGSVLVEMPIVPADAPAVTPGTGTVPSVQCDETPAIMTYTRREEDPEIWEADLFVAVSMTLATFVASPLSGRFEWYEKARNQAQEAVARANIVQRDIENARADTVIVDDPAPPWLRARTRAGYAARLGAPVAEVTSVGTSSPPFYARPPDLTFGNCPSAVGR